MAKGKPEKRRPAKRVMRPGRADAAAKRAAPRPPAKKAKPAAEPATPEQARTFRLGAIAGTTPGIWIDRWKERMPRVPLEFVPMAYPGQRSALADVDAALVRLPLDREGLSVIPLYDEVAVVVMAAESALTVAVELDLEDLVGELLIVPQDDVLGAFDVPGAAAPRFAAPADTAEAIATVAAGVGVVIVPMSLARLHHRKDTEFRPLRGGPASTVALAWETARTTADVEAFVGIVRGRTAQSSRA